MSAPLEGLRIAVLETHRSEEAAAHVRRFGGVPVCVPAARDSIHPERLRPLIDRLVSGKLSVVVFMTGPGATILLEEANRLGRLQETLAALRSATIVCRGPKPVAVLRNYDVPIHFAATEPYTTRQVLQSLDAVDVDGKAIALVPHSEPNSVLAAGLSSRGARPEAWSIYESTLPDDLASLKALVRELIEGQLDAIVFSNRSQCRHLFRVAEELGGAAALTDSLNTKVIVAAVGPVCAEALAAFDVAADVIPARPTLESMIAALAEYVELTREDGSE